MAHHDLLTCPVRGLGDAWPEQLLVVQHVPSQKYGCYCHEGVLGLAAFTFEEAAWRFVDWVELGEMELRSVTFDEAREIAKDRPLPVVSLILLDSLDSPRIHFVR